MQRRHVAPVLHAGRRASELRDHRLQLQRIRHSRQRRQGDTHRPARRLHHEPAGTAAVHDDGLRSQSRYRRRKPLPEKLGGGCAGNHADRRAGSRVRDGDGNRLQPRTRLRAAARVRHRHPGHERPRAFPAGRRSQLAQGSRSHRRGNRLRRLPRALQDQGPEEALGRRSADRALAPRVQRQGRHRAERHPDDLPGPPDHASARGTVRGQSRHHLLHHDADGRGRKLQSPGVRTELLVHAVVHPLGRPRRARGRTRLPREQIVR